MQRSINQSIVKPYPKVIRAEPRRKGMIYCAVLPHTSWPVDCTGCWKCRVTLWSSQSSSGIQVGRVEDPCDFLDASEMPRPRDKRGYVTVFAISQAKNAVPRWWTNTFTAETESPFTTYRDKQRIRDGMVLSHLSVVLRKTVTRRD